MSDPRDLRMARFAKGFDSSDETIHATLVVCVEELTNLVGMLVRQMSPMRVIPPLTQAQVVDQLKAITDELDWL